MKQFVAILALGLGSACLAQDPGRGALAKEEKQVERGDETGLLSDLLPARLAEFVKRAGSNRELGTVPQEELENLSGGETDARLLLETLRPKAFVWYEGSATILGPVPAVDAIRSADDRRTLLVAGSIVTFSNGKELRIGDEIFAGDTISTGAVLNAGETSVAVATPSGLILLGPGEALDAQCGKACSVTCGTGTFACCNTVGGCSTCPCFPNGSSTACQSGGPGATQCSTGFVIAE